MYPYPPHFFTATVISVLMVALLFVLAGLIVKFVFGGTLASLFKLLAASTDNVPAGLDRYADEVVLPRIKRGETPYN